ncbi:MAG: hypothetical protein IT352_15405 [Gemmatimonadales bacterium]|nr:hypothetical protein [Gemmatimonadales bacterium]
MAIATDRPGIAQATDARVSATGLLGLFRPGPRGAVDPIGPGPRPRAAPSVLHSRRTAIGARYAHQLAIQAGGKPTPPPPYTEADARAVSVVRKAAVGRAAPMTYRKDFVAPFRSSSVATEGDVTTSDGGAAKLPCIDCGR